MPKQFYKIAQQFRKEHKGRMSLQDLKLIYNNFNLKKA